MYNILKGLQAGVRSPVLYSIGDAIDSISEFGDKINEIFSNIGSYCVEWANGAIAAYHKLTSSAAKILQLDSDDSMFSDFWKVINSVSSVLCVIASSLIVLFFVANLCSESWDSRHDLDMWHFAKDIVKLIVSVAVVSNALFFVKLIFSAGAKLAMLVTLTNSDLSDELMLTDTVANYLIYGVSGVRGLFIFLIFLLASVVVVVCAVIITMEIYQRLFKIYVLIPFSTLSFSTFVIGEHRHGNEVFYGYLKNIIQTAIEGLVIMILLFFSYSLVANGKTMKTLFPTFNEFDAVTVSLKKPEDANALVVFLDEYCKYKKNNSQMEYSDYLKNYCDDMQNPDMPSIHWTGNVFVDAEEIKEVEEELEQLSAIEPFSCEDVTPELLDALNSASTEINEIVYGVRGIYSYGASAKQGIKMLGQMDYGTSLTEVTVSMFPNCSVLDAIMIMLQFVFPCVLCAGSIKAASTYSGLVLGK